jgi:adenylosuccinate lyase
VTFGFKVANWYSEMKRGAARMERAREEISFGKLSGAVGTFAHNDPAIEADVMCALGLKPEPVSSQVIPRDRHAAFLQAIALVGAGIERIATEIRHLQRTEVLEVEEPFAKGQKGSSAMPHKRNPVISENLCGLARLLRGNALASLESVALWHERDISHSSVERVVLPDSTILLDYMVHRLKEVLEGLQVYPDRMRSNMESTAEIVCSQRLVVALTKKGLPKQRAYEIVQRHAQDAWVRGTPFRAAATADPQIAELLTNQEIKACFDLRPFVKNIGAILKRSLV